MENFRVHFCYLDGINALIGRYHWRYEVMDREEMYHQIVSLDKLGMVEFRYRRVGPFRQVRGEWINISPRTAKDIIRFVLRASDKAAV
jgi:hypothetical protein